MAATVTVREILTYHSLECRAFERLLLLGRPREASKNVVVLWMWLERIGFQDLVAAARASPDPALVRYVREAEAVLDVLVEDAAPPADNPRAIPQTTAHVSQPISLRFFYANRDVVIKGMSDIMDGVGRLIFNDALRELMRTNPSAPALARLAEGGNEPTPEHLRTMFIMFTRNLPVPREHIAEFFTLRWPGCLERVIVESSTVGAAPMYGRVVFKSEAYLDLVLGRQQQTEFLINGRQLWGLRPMKNAYYSSGRR